MAWREKIAWMTLAAMALAYGIYFSLASSPGRSTTDMLLLFGGVTTLQVVGVTVASVVLALASGADARARPDERDRAIGRRAAGAAYFVLMVGMILVGVVMPFGPASGWRIANAALLALVVAEAARHIIVVASYRRGWHG